MKKSSHTTKKKSLTLGGFIGRFHAIIFVILVCGGLTVAVYMLSTVINESSTPSGYTPPSTDTSFDAQTIEKVERLRDLNTPPASFQFPDGRVDPFSE